MPREYAWWPQYDEARQAYPDALILIQLGDFYEAFGDDAERLELIADLYVTRRKRGDDVLKMCGFPTWTLNTYLEKLIDADIFTVVVEQQGNVPITGVVVPRAITRVVDPKARRW